MTGSEEGISSSSTLVGSSTRGSIVDSCTRQTTLNWTAREKKDCVQDLEAARREIISSISARYNNCCHKSFKILAKCLDLHSLVCLLCGCKTNGSEAVPYNTVHLARYGFKEFEQIIDYLASVPRIQESGISIDPFLARQFHDKIKSALSSAVWGDLFARVGSKMFKIVEGPLSGKMLCDLEGDSFVTELSTVASSEFCLECLFDVRLSTSAGTFRVKFEEANL